MAKCPEHGDRDPSLRTDEHGSLLYQPVRYDPKDFKQRSPDGQEGSLWKKGPRQVLYRLGEVIETPVYASSKHFKLIPLVFRWRVRERRLYHVHQNTHRFFPCIRFAGVSASSP
jgi:hypothetical protein